ncbi:MAG: hypothetical protein Athens101410_670 [Parcubacteria group bacterium Athens1014_10]|nr:MAG: hypothetical protein Athens101410_670 [Parcubacteria group bacterium Athens1014_10]TSD05179.1 MAG: hypothetical protein Athens071412_377 [Parcubacteria group bacterium Athens0714_12]
MAIKIIKDCVAKAELGLMAKNQFGDFVKAVVDIEREIMAIGGDLHADEEAMLLEDGSAQENLWGINLYPFFSEDEWIEFDSMINIRPSQNNRSRGVEDSEIREKIKNVVKKLVSV